MSITNEQWDEILTLQERGDIPKVAREAGVPKSTMYLYMKEKNCPIEVAEAILEFYKKRKEHREALKNILLKNRHD